MAPPEDSPVSPSSSRTTSNRPTVPPEKGAKDSVPPDTKRRDVVADVATPPAPPNAATERNEIQTAPEERAAVGSEDIEAPLSAGDFQSIPPTVDEESLAPSTDVESLPPSTDARLTPPVFTPDVVPFSSALVPPQIGGGSRTEETTSAPVVKPVGSEAGLDLSSTLMSSQAGNAARRKIVIFVAAGAGVLVLAGLVRVATSGGSNEQNRLSASAAVSASPQSPPSAETPAPAESEQPEPPTPSAVAPEPAEADAPGSPTSAPAGSPAAATTNAAQKHPLPPVKKKPYRPSGI
jgi:hypothetical protein